MGVCVGSNVVPFEQVGRYAICGSCGTRQEVFNNGQGNPVIANHTAYTELSTEEGITDD